MVFQQDFRKMYKAMVANEAFQGFKLSERYIEDYYVIKFLMTAVVLSKVESLVSILP